MANLSENKILPEAKLGKIFSINIGKEKGVSKQAIAHAYLEENFGIRDDIHAGGDKRQVSLLSWESICQQQACPKVKKKGIKFKPGDFAENITTAGLSLTNLKIGDRFTIKDKVILEVAQIGKKCHNYCEIYKQIGNCIMPKQGIFAKVIKGGKISVGDPIYLTETITKDSHIFKEFTQTAKANPAKQAIIFKSESLTYAQVFKKAIKLGNILKDSGIKSDDKVSCLLENQPEYAIAFFATVYAGATFVPFDIQLSSEQIKQLIFHSESKILIVTNKLYANLKRYLKNIEIIIVDSGEFRKRLDNYNADDRFDRQQSGNNLAVLFYTSGTTDLPKAVMLSHSNLLSNFNSLKQSHILMDNDIVVSVLPLHHAYPFTVTMLTPLLLGSTIAYPRGLTSTDLLNCMGETQASIFVGVPQIFSLMQRAISEKINRLFLPKRIVAHTLGELTYLIRKTLRLNLSKYLFSNIHKAFGRNLRFMASGGARLEPDIADAFFRWGFTILEGYGLTETSPVVTFNPLDKPKIGSVGKSVPTVEIKIINQDEKGIGEVTIKGPNVMPGYYKMEHQTKETIKDGWLLTGDLGYMDKERYLYLTGRKKEIIVLSSGKNINPEEVEKHYLMSPFIKEICVLAIKATGFVKGVEHLAGIIVIDEEHFKTKGETNIRNKLRWELDNLSAKLPTYKRIRGFVVSKEGLPRTRLGKIMRHKIEHIYAQLLETSKPKQEHLKDEDRDILYTNTSQHVLSFLRQTLKREVNINDHLELDLGLDSLGRVELLLGLENSLTLEISDGQTMNFFMSNTVKDLMLKVNELMPQITKQVKTDKFLRWEKILEEKPHRDTLDKINLKPGFGNIIISLVVITLFRIFFRIFFLLRIEGKDNLNKNGPYLICPNHTSYLDGLFVLSALPFKVVLNTYFVGYSVIFEHFLLKWLIKTARLIPLEVSLNMIEALRACSYVLRNSKIVCYFAEGQRSMDGKVEDFKKGVGVLIKELDIGVVPVYIEGGFRAWPRYRILPRPAKIKIKFGKTLRLNELLPKDTREEEIYKTVANNLRIQVSNLGER